MKVLSLWIDSRELGLHNRLPLVSNKTKFLSNEARNLIHLVSVSKIGLHITVNTFDLAVRSDSLYHS